MKPTHLAILDLIREAGDCLLGVEGPRAARARAAIQEAATKLYPLAAMEREELERPDEEMSA